jgi:hypothetical protein
MRSIRPTADVAHLARQSRWPFHQWLKGTLDGEEKDALMEVLADILGTTNPHKVHRIITFVNEITKRGDKSDG